MPTSASESPTNNSYHRTNSLAFAKTDCHTCSDLKRWCDRQRPQCGTCIKHRRKCGGFVLDLTWKDQLNREARSPDASVTGVGTYSSITTDCDAVSQRQFIFKQGRPRKKRKIRDRHDKEINTDVARTRHTRSSQSQKMRSPQRTNTTEETALEEHFLLQAVTETVVSDMWNQSDESSYQALGFENWPSVPSWITFDEVSTPCTIGVSECPTEYSSVSCVPENQDFSGNSPLFELDIADSTSSIYCADPELCCDNELATISAANSPGNGSVSLYSTLSLSPHGVLYENVHHKFGSVLAMYDEEFCIMPLTMDCSTNPFRVRQETSQGSQFLLHAILAISMQHLAKKSHDETLATEMLAHRSTATHLYSEALSGSNALTLLDTLLIIVNLDATQSASGTWDVHLVGALNLVESAGGVAVCKLSPRIRAQIAMLVWWDVSIAFVSRQEPLFPLIYLETLLEYDRSDGWSFFGLNGCPGQLVLAMAQLAKLAAIYEKIDVLNCEWTSFNLFPVEEIMDEVKNWKNKDDSSFQDVKNTDDINSKRDIFHCSEAWRHAIILYILRVFTRKQDLHGLQSTSFLARVILDHIRCIKQDKLIQKQVLIPIFLAAAEIEDETDRVFIRQYCTHWSASSRYFMFETTKTIIERIWAGWQVQTRDTYWWGVIVSGGPPSEGRQDHPMVNQLLLG